MADSPRISKRAQSAGGQPISFLMQQALAYPNLISLAAGFVDQETLPVEPVRLAFENLWADEAEARAALQYGTTPGYLPLRERLLSDLLQADGQTSVESTASVDNLVLTAGSNQMLHLVSDTLLDPGDIVLCSSPTYFVYLGILKNLGARSFGVPSDEQGMIPAALVDALESLEASGDLPRVKAIYVVSYFDNPRGVTLSADRRAAIVEIAQQFSRYTRIRVIDDMAYRELRYAGDDAPGLRAFDDDGQTVITAHTFSKSFSPGLRVGYGLLPDDLVGPVCEQKSNIDFGSPNFNQYLLLAALETGLVREHVERLQEAYQAKLEQMLSAADEFFAPLDRVRWLRPDGGLYVWLQVPESIDTGPNGRLLDLAVQEGVLYVPGEYCYPSEGTPVAHNLIRLSFGVQSGEGIRAGVAALARAIANAME